jgi:hypothetical protein
MERKTMSVPDAGAVFFGLGRNAAYRAAKRGDIPTVRIGGRILVPVAQLERLLNPDTAAAPNPGS